jgi:hypothetical protein
MPAGADGSAEPPSLQAIAAHLQALETQLTSEVVAAADSVVADVKVVEMEQRIAEGVRGVVGNLLASSLQESETRITQRQAEMQAEMGSKVESAQQGLQAAALTQSARAEQQLKELQDRTDEELTELKGTEQERKLADTRMEQVMQELREDLSGRIDSVKAEITATSDKLHTSLLKVVVDKLEAAEKEARRRLAARYTLHKYI